MIPATYLQWDFMMMKDVLKYYLKKVFQQNKNDIQLSMMLEMSNPPKNVYYSYDDKKTKRGVSGKTRIEQTI